jgi:MFS family permease
VALVFVARFIESAQLVAHRATRTHHAGLILTLRAHRRILAVAGAGQVFALVIRTGTGVIIPLYAAEVLGLEVGQIGLIVSLASAMDLVLFYPAGLVMDRWGRKYAIVPSFLIQAGGMALLPFTGSPIGLLLAAGLISFGNGLGSGSMLTVGSDLAPAESRGEFLGLWSLIGDIGITGGPLAIGGIAGALSLGAAAWVIAGSGLGAALIFAFLVPETLVRPAPVRESASPLPQVEHQQG